ncbi:MAG TPA: penicillin-binding transpeptidase domain-containing protein, partial [Pirellulales bacterium]
MSFEPSDVYLPLASLRNRLRWLLAVFIVFLLTVYARLIALEVRDGPEYRAMASEPIVRKQTVPGMRGQILARDGTVLAYDQPLVDLTVNYRWLEEPADPRWLLHMVRARLSAAERRDTARVVQEQQMFLAERRQLWQRLASLCGLTQEQWRSRTERIQQQIETMASGVNARHQSEIDARMRPVSADESKASFPIRLLAMIGRSLGEALSAWDDMSTPASLTIEEELTDHVVYQDLPLEVVAEIETHPQQYPGVTLIHSYRRAYPEGDLAAHLVGYLGLAKAEEIAGSLNSKSDSYQADDWVGRAGVERQYEQSLCGQRGLTIIQLDARGHTINSTVTRRPAAGRDVVLTIDSALQRTAQTLLDEALNRRLPSGDGQLDAAAGGALVAIDVHSGAILAAAAAPRFDPSKFTEVDNQSINGWLGDPARPLFDRTVQMALPPGSVFKVISAVALLSAGVEPDAPFECQGYLHQPDALRCAIFRRFGIGHGPVTLADALARSCNVYFFHYAEQIGAAPLVDWARRLGMGDKTGIDLPGEASGNVPATSEAGGESFERKAIAGSTDHGFSAPASLSLPDPLMVCIGQGPITATPLQVVRMMASIANGGYLVTPHVAQRLELPIGNQLAEDGRRQAIPRPFSDIIWPEPRRIVGLNSQILAVIRKGLRQTVADEQGTAHAVINVGQVTIAGKTGTAETGSNQPENAWFVGFAPAEQPQVAFVVVLEYA